MRPGRDVVQRGRDLPRSALCRERMRAEYNEFASLRQQNVMLDFDGISTR